MSAMMRGGEWKKLGLLLAAPLGPEWSCTHAALPTIDVTGPRSDRAGLYVATRDRTRRSSIARAELDLAKQSPRVVALDPEPVLAPGATGAFDAVGVTPSCVVRRGDDTLLYYTGWSRGVSLPYCLAIGLAVSRDGGPFERVSQAPIVGCTATDPFMTASPHVLVGGDGWRMWYVSCARWQWRGGDLRLYYHLRHATSRDGVRWHADGHVCVDFADLREYAFSRPCVMGGDDGYEMWFSVRGDAYRLGYARSDDGLVWRRRDAAATGLFPSARGWDAEMVAYPQVFEHRGRRLMLYNGNGYGATGVGTAVAA